MPLVFHWLRASVAVDARHDHRRAMLAEANLAAPVVFCTKPGGFISKSSFISQVYKPLLKRAGVPYRNLYVIRHSHASELLSRGVPVPEVARRL